MWKIVIFEAAEKDRDQGARLACRRFISRLLLRAGVLAQLVTMWAGTHGAHAQNATWRTSPVSGDFDTDANWSPAAVPTGTATFGASKITNISFSTVTLVGALQFSAGAPAYSFHVSTSDLEIDGTGIVNNSSNRPTLTNSASAGTFFQNASTAGNAIIGNVSGGFTDFQNSSSAGAAVITNNNSGSATFFVDTSTASHATITTNSGAFTEFFNSSTAGNATITTNSDGATTFSNSSTAGNATVITNSGGITEFFDSSTAGNASIVTNSGGTTAFLNSASGGNARFITKSGGTVDISLLSSAGTVVGSIEGAGTYRLGSKKLTVGVNNLSTKVSGTITDGGLGGGAGGSLIKVGTGTLTLSGNNTYSGGTIIDDGTLIVDSAQALGLGNVRLNAGVLAADPRAINVQGNYFQGPNGTLQLQIAGANPGQFDFLNVTGNATLGGTLQLINQNFHPKASDELTLVKTGGIVTGAFSRFIDPFTTGSGFNTIDLVYNRQSVVLEFLNVVGPPHPVVTINFASFAQTPNQLAAAKLLDAVELDPRTSNLIAFVLERPFTNIPSDLDIFSPESLSSFYEISFSAANIQRLTLENRLDELRVGSGSINVSVGNGLVGLDKTTGDGKTSKNPVEPTLKSVPQQHFDLWAVGFGDFVKLDSDFNARGYQFTTGGFDLGFDYRFLDHFAIGVMGSYARTWTDLRPGNIAVNTGRGGLYASYFTGGSDIRENYGTFYLNAGIYGGHNTYDSTRQGLAGNAIGNTDGNEWSGFISAGYDFHHGNLTIGPIASLQYTNVYISGFSETGSLAPLSIHSDSEESLRSDLGFRAFYQWHLGELLLAPYLTAAWEREFKYSALPITAGFADIPGPNETFFGPVEGQDSAVLTAGLSVQWTPMISTYVGYDGQLGRGRYNSNAVTGGMRVSW